LSSSGIARILRGSGGRNVTAAPFSLAIPDLGPGSGARHTLAERLEEARAAGYKAGYEAGRAAYRDSADAERAQRLDALTSALEQAAARAARDRVELLSQTEREAVELAIELAEAILQRELDLGLSSSSEAVSRALGLVPLGEDLVIHVHPGDEVDVEDLMGPVPESSMKIVPDPSVDPGGCVITAGSCHIDVQIGAALERARALLTSVAPHHLAGEPGDSGTSS